MCGCLVAFVGLLAFVYCDGVWGFGACGFSGFGACIWVYVRFWYELWCLLISEFLFGLVIWVCYLGFCWVYVSYFGYCVTGCILCWSGCRVWLWLSGVCCWTAILVGASCCFVGLFPSLVLWYFGGLAHLAWHLCCLVI